MPFLRRLSLLLDYAGSDEKSALGRSCTCDLLIRSQPLCLLSYEGVENGAAPWI